MVDIKEPGILVVAESASDHPLNRFSATRWPAGRGSVLTTGVAAGLPLLPLFPVNVVARSCSSLSRFSTRIFSSPRLSRAAASYQSLARRRAIVEALLSSALSDSASLYQASAAASGAPGSRTAARTSAVAAATNRLCPPFARYGTPESKSPIPGATNRPTV